MTRGPTEPVPPPPADLPSRALPLVRWPAGTTVARIHRRRHGPILFSGGPRQAPLGRWDSPTGAFAALYVAEGFAGAFAETVLRNPARLLVSLAEIEARVLSRLAVTAAIDLVDLTGPGLSRLGLDARILSGPYEACGAWADALHAHPVSPGGLLYPSRFDPSQVCAVLFDRVARRIEAAGPPTPLRDLPAAVGAALDAYGKALDPG